MASIAQPPLQKAEIDQLIGWTANLATDDGRVLIVRSWHPKVPSNGPLSVTVECWFENPFKDVLQDPNVR
jgi:hypothetical protein